MRILAVIQGTYGKRVVGTLRSHGPPDWEIHTWVAPSLFPPIIEEPEEFLPESMLQSDLLLSLGENAGVAELIPGLAQLSKVKAVVAPVDNREWLPAGLKNQLREELEFSGVNCVFPSPFCCLSEKMSENEYIRTFAKYFGNPKFTISCNHGKIANISIKREAPCGATRFIAEKLTGVRSGEAELKAGLFHHYYPCLASGKIDGGFKDSLLHQSADMTQRTVGRAVIACQRG